MLPDWLLISGLMDDPIAKFLSYNSLFPYCNCTERLSGGQDIRNQFTIKSKFGQHLFQLFTRPRSGIVTMYGLKTNMFESDGTSQMMDVRVVLFEIKKIKLHPAIFFLHKLDRLYIYHHGHNVLHLLHRGV